MHSYIQCCNRVRISNRVNGNNTHKKVRYLKMKRTHGFDNLLCHFKNLQNFKIYYKPSVTGLLRLKLICNRTAILKQHSVVICTHCKESPVARTKGFTFKDLPACDIVELYNDVVDRIMIFHVENSGHKIFPIGSYHAECFLVVIFGIDRFPPSPISP